MIPLQGFLQNLANPDTIADGKASGKNNRLPWRQKKDFDSFPRDGKSSEFHDSIRKLMGYDVTGRSAAHSDPDFRGNEFGPDLPTFNQLKRMVSEQLDPPSETPDEITTLFVPAQTGKEASITQQFESQQNDSCSSKKPRWESIEKLKADAVVDTTLPDGIESAIRDISTEMPVPSANGPDTDAHTTDEKPYSEPVTGAPLEDEKNGGSVLSDSTPFDDTPGNKPRLVAVPAFGSQSPIEETTKPITPADTESPIVAETQKIQNFSTRGMAFGDAKNSSFISNSEDMKRDVVLESQSKITSTGKESGAARNASLDDSPSLEKRTAMQQEILGERTNSASAVLENGLDTEFPSLKDGSISKSPDQKTGIPNKAAGVVPESPLKNLISKTATGHDNNAGGENRSTQQLATDSSSTGAKNQVPERLSKNLVAETVQGNEYRGGGESQSLRPPVASQFIEVTDPVAEDTSKTMVSKGSSGVENRTAVAPGAFRTIGSTLSQGGFRSGSAVSPVTSKGESDLKAVEAKVVENTESTVPFSSSWRTKAAEDTARSTLNQVSASDDGLDTVLPMGKGEKPEITEEAKNTESAIQGEEHEKMKASSRAVLLDDSEDTKAQTKNDGREHQLDGKTRSFRLAPNHIDSRDGKTDPNLAGDTTSTSNLTEKAPQRGMKTVDSFSFQPIESKNGKTETGQTPSSPNQEAAALQSSRPAADPSAILRRFDGGQSFQAATETVSAFATKTRFEKERIDIAGDQPVEETGANEKGFREPVVVQATKIIRNTEFSENPVGSPKGDFADKMKGTTPAPPQEEIVVREENQRQAEHLSDNMKSNGPDPARLHTAHDEVAKPAPTTANTGGTSTGHAAASNPRPFMPGSAYQSSVMDQVVRHTVVRSLKGRSEVQIQLKPEFLGNVRMNIATEKDQIMVRIVTDSAAVKETIDSHLHQLKAELHNQGLTIDKFEVTVHSEADHHSGHEQSSQMQRNTTSHNGRQAGDGQQTDSEGRGRGKHARDEHPKRNPHRRNGISHFA